MKSWSPIGSTSFSCPVCEPAAGSNGIARVNADACAFPAALDVCVAPVRLAVAGMLARKGDARDRPTT
jgi:hypothetical protein